MLKKNVMIRIERDVIEKAKEIGLNISKVSENALKDMINRIENPNYKNKPKKGSDNSQNNDGQTLEQKRPPHSKLLYVNTLP